MTPTTRLSDWTPARATALQRLIELNSRNKCDDDPCEHCAGIQAAAASLGYIAQLERELAELRSKIDGAGK